MINRNIFIKNRKSLTRLLNIINQWRRKSAKSIEIITHLINLASIHLIRRHYLTHECPNKQKQTLMNHHRQCGIYRPLIELKSGVKQKCLIPNKIEKIEAQVSIERCKVGRIVFMVSTKIWLINQGIRSEWAWLIQTNSK